MKNSRLLTLLSAAIFLTGLVTAGSAQAQGTLFVEGNNVGLGIASPAYPLHLVRTSGGETRMFQIDNAGPARTTFNNTTAPGVWSFGHENNDHFAINRGGTGTQEFSIAPNGAIIVDGSIVHTSSRAAKTNFQNLDPTAVLKKISALEIAEWSYNDESAEVRHIGPTAEDFYAAFQLGTDDKHIAVNDSAGVALAAIKGLHQVVQEKDHQVEALRVRLQEKDAQLERLVERLDALEARLK